MTDILNMTDDELARAAVEAFTPKPYKHGVEIFSEDGWSTECPKCGGEIVNAGPTCGPTDGKDKNKPCPHPDPLDVTDWNVAMRLRDKVLSNADRFGDGMITVYYFENPEFKPNDTDEAVQLKFASHYFAVWATPQDYIKAALLALKGD